MSYNNQSQTPVRIRMISYRYEVAESLFETILRSATGITHGLPPMENLKAVSPEEELLMGIFADDDSDSGFFVRPAKPRAMEAVHDPSTDEEDDGLEKLELYSEGLLVYTPDGDDAQISLAYDESELTGMDGAHSVLTYHSSEPELIHLIRSGSVTTALTFKPHHRAICVYETPYMPFQVGIHCLLVENKLVDEGTLILDYIIEIRGAQAERCRMELTLL